MSKGRRAENSRSEVLQGTLDLMILRISGVIGRLPRLEGQN
jgi:hypothetical protein